MAKKRARKPFTTEDTENTEFFKFFSVASVLSVVKPLDKTTELATPLARRAAGIVLHIHENLQHRADALQGEEVQHGGQGLGKKRDEVIQDVQDRHAFIDGEQT